MHAASKHFDLPLNEGMSTEVYRPSCIHVETWQGIVELSASTPSADPRFRIWPDGSCMNATWQSVDWRVQSFKCPLFMFVFSTMFMQHHGI